ncbi:uncharacterized protein [Primulina huaijiensis]|uniref:uncharacterized protein isoform X1 n=1 Tax=Primulina huaijiensis TaxID=1492673 RepID=UPI003CC6F512
MSPVLKMGYVMMASWNVVMAIGSVGGCVEDGDMNETAKKILIIAFHLSKWAEVRVCGACAKFLCGGIVGCWVGEDELWNKLYEDQTSIAEFKFPESFVDCYEPLSCHARQWMTKQALLLVPACALVYDLTTQL